MFLRRKIQYTVFTFSFFIITHINYSQKPVSDLKLKPGKTYEKINPNAENAKTNFEQDSYQNYYYLIVQFESIPDEALLKQLSTKKIEILQYLSGTSYWVKIPTELNFSELKSLKFQNLIKLNKNSKAGEKLQKLLNTDLLNFTSTKAIVNIQVSKDISTSTLKSKLSEEGISIINSKFENGGFITAEVPLSKINSILSLPYVLSVETTTNEDVPLNNLTRSVHSIFSLTNPTGRNLSANGVTLGIGDNDDVSIHIDLKDRVINRSPVTASTPNGHGSHVAGTMAGAGLNNEYLRGTANKAQIINYYYSDVISYSPIQITDNHLIATNNSYHSVSEGCAGEGEYDVLSNYVDAQIKEYDKLSHVYAVGNDGDFTCSPYPKSFQTVKSGWQSAKNIISVGAGVGQWYLVEYYSSRGPTKDGRLKPEIIAAGSRVASTGNGNNNYFNNYGTSMAAPTITGLIGLLTERYRQLHSNSDPKSALMKAIICNSADDILNPGPDYTSGFGWLNARKAVEDLEAETYFISSISNSGNTNHSIVVPNGVKQLKVLLYWHDKEASPLASQALVNDLDLTVSDGTNNFQPWILNSTPAGVNNTAIRGVDRVNNIEQITINDPVAGNYTLSVNGFNIPYGPQEYVLVYEFVMPDLKIEYPIGGESFIPNTYEAIQWRVYDGNNSNTFKIEYSTDNGSNWSTIIDNLSGDRRYYYWLIPTSLQTSQALVRVTRNGGGLTAQSDANFTILNTPNVSAAGLCEGAVQLTWNTISGADDYEVFQKQGAEMKSIGVTTNLYYNIYNLPSTLQYFGVRARINNKPGRRSLAASITPNSGACADAVFDNDLKMVAVLSPETGRKFTSTQLGNQNIIVRIKNLDNNATSGTYNVSYRVNGGSIITENVNVSISAGGVFDYTYATTYDFSSTGIYTIETWVKNSGDVQENNDTIIKIIKQLPNEPISLPFNEGFETATASSYSDSAKGLSGLDRCDFFTNTIYGRARTFVNSDFQRTGTKALTLDNKSFRSSTSINYAILTFNLSNYSSNSDGLRLHGYYRNHQQLNQTNNKIWIRGSDTDSWIEAYSLSSNVNTYGSYKFFNGIRIDDLLYNYGQIVSSSFQVRIGQQGNTSANKTNYDGNIDLDDGYTFDDLQIVKAENDIELLNISSPSTEVCGIGYKTITINIRNNSTTNQNNVKVFFKINGTTIEETIPYTLLSKSQYTYSFNTQINTSIPGFYLLDAWCNLSTDSYNYNDSVLNYSFRVNKLVSTFPYLEDFETSNGDWYASSNSSWEWGAPGNNKQYIKKAPNGTNAWITKLNTNYKDNELSYLYSPCYDLTSLAKPVLSFSHIFRTEDDCNCDKHWMEYSTDGINWVKLGDANKGTNWYDEATLKLWKQSDTIWHVSSIDIPLSSTSMRFRFVFSSDPAVNYDGVGIDDVHIFDKAQIYTGTSNPYISNLTVNGNNWVHFNDANGKRIVSLNPQGQNLGLTSVNLFINTSSVRYTNIQYYHDRNLVVTPQFSPTSNVKIRYYFTDQESRDMIAGIGCTSCTSIKSAYDAGITQYSAIDNSQENGTISDNTNSNGYAFYIPSTVKVVPYDTGYYAEFDITHFSEFWINNGGPNNNLSLLGSFPTAVNNIINTIDFIKFTAYKNHQLYIATGKLNSKKMQVHLLDITGKVVYSNIYNYQNTMISNIRLGTGIYFLKITGDKQEYYIDKIFIE